MTITFVKFQEDISMTGELFLHYNYPANWWAHLESSSALIMISNDTNLFRRREQKHILWKSKSSWLFVLFVLRCKKTICKQPWRWFVWATVIRPGHVLIIILPGEAYLPIYIAHWHLMKTAFKIWSTVKETFGK